MTNFLTESRLERILENRERFMSADLNLGDSLQSMLEGGKSAESCLMALVEQQRAYDQYVSGVISCLGTPMLVQADYTAEGQELDN